MFEETQKKDGVSLIHEKGQGKKTNTKRFPRAYINDSNGWNPGMNDSSSPGFDNGRNDSSRFPVCEICATDDCR